MAYVCRLFHDWFTIPEIHGQWEGDTAGGSTKNFKNNPQWTLELDAPTDLLITLTQQSVRGTDLKRAKTELQIFAAQGKRWNPKDHPPPTDFFVFS